MNDLQRLVEAAVQAPTGDNCQPWRFAVHPGAIELTFDRTVAASVFNVRDVATRLALGAAWENMCLRASTLGLRLHGDVDEGDPPQLRLHVEHDPSATADPLARQIGVRRTNRLPYQRRPLPGDTVRALEACTGDAAEVVVRTGRDARALFPLIGRCDRLRWEHGPLIQELFAKIRFDALAKYASRSGLAYDTLGVGPAPLACLRWLSRGQRAARLGPLGLSRGMALQSLLLLRTSAAVVLLRCQVEQPRALILAGRVMQRTWLCASERGVALQPLASVPLLGLRAAWGEDPDFAPHHRSLLQELHASWRRLTDGPGGRYAILAFRAGFAAAVPPALRKPVSAFVTTGDHDER